MTSLDSFRCARTLKVGSKTYAYFSLPIAEKNGLKGISRLPFSMKVLLENLLRNEDGRTVTKEDIQAVAAWLKTKSSEREIAFRPARVLMQDFTGVPAVVDLAAMRDAMTHLGGDPKKINPLVPVDLVIDHFGDREFLRQCRRVQEKRRRGIQAEPGALQIPEMGAGSFENFRVVPPGTGICHQVNLEYLSQTVWTGQDKVKIDGKEATYEVAYPDTLVGTDSHTTMVNGLAVLGWGVGGIEAEAAMLGQPLSMLLAGGDRLQAHRQAERGHDGDRPRADRHADAAQARRGRTFRGVLRSRPRQHVDRGPRDHRQYGSGIRRDLRLFPDRRRDARLSARHRAQGRARSSSWKPMPRRRACFG
jgi:aconitate hydratase